MYTEGERNTESFNKDLFTLINFKIQGWLGTLQKILEIISRQNVTSSVLTTIDYPIICHN